MVMIDVCLLVSPMCLQVPDFPVMNYLSKPMRIKASGDDTADWERLSLWAGQGFTMQVHEVSYRGENSQAENSTLFV